MSNELVKRNMDKLKKVLSAESVQEQFKNALAANSGPFVASVIELYGNEKTLQECEPSDVVMEALRAATLKLPINKQLGFAYLVPYREGGKAKPQMQIGYRGLIQLAVRTKQYRYINADVVYEGELKGFCKLTGEVDITGTKTSEKVIGYFAYFELIPEEGQEKGFSKTKYMTIDEMKAHMDRYSKSAKSERSAWKTNFNEMGCKTVLRLLLNHYGFLTTEMASALSSDNEDVDSRADTEITMNANSEAIDVEYTVENENGDASAPAANEPIDAGF